MAPSMNPSTGSGRSPSTSLRTGSGRSPFLEVVTRCCQRPGLLKRNQNSLKAQICTDFMQTLLIDGKRRGIAWAQENLGMYAPHLVGRFVWLLDDDDECIYPALIAELKEIVAASSQGSLDVIMLKMDHGPRGILPGPEDWGHGVNRGGVGCSAYVVRREMWQAHAGAWLPGEYSSDFNFIAAVFASNPSIYWHDVIASRVQRISMGQAEKRGRMKVKATISFVGYDTDGKKHRIVEGQEFDLPPGVDWLDKGLVVLPAKDSLAAKAEVEKSRRGKKEAAP